MAVKIKLLAPGLLDYVKAGKDAFQKTKKTMYSVLNVGRKVARQKITSEFKTRTGFLRRRARSMQVKVTVRASQISGEVKPIPRLMNIFESGATLAHGRGHLEARPVVAPAQAAMDSAATREFTAILAEVGK